MENPGSWCWDDLLLTNFTQALPAGHLKPFFTFLRHFEHFYSVAAHIALLGDNDQCHLDGLFGWSVYVRWHSH